MPLPEAPEEGISIHAPLAGCDFFRSSRSSPPNDFNPRTPCGVRPTRLLCRDASENFNPRTPCGVRLLPLSTHPQEMRISIHAPLAGCDEILRNTGTVGHYFNPRTPCGVRRVFVGAVLLGLNFNPRTPCGVRPCGGRTKGRPSRFQSTHPLRGATALLAAARARDLSFQSTHPLRGATPLRTIRL